MVRGEIERRAGIPLPENAPSPSRVFSVPPGVTLTDRVTAGEAAAIALWNNTALEADLAAIGIAQADLLDAGLFALLRDGKLRPALELVQRRD